MGPVSTTQDIPATIRQAGLSTVVAIYRPRLPQFVTGGTYTLLVALDEDARVEVGALGEFEFPAGWYAYTGSAVGPGGFTRVDRHREVAAGERDVRHWHVDFLLGHPTASVRDVVRSPDATVECTVARSLPAGPADGFGASDCRCRSHLAGPCDERDLRRAVRAAHDDARKSVRRHDK
jgi:endonuclease-3